MFNVQLPLTLSEATALKRYGAEVNELTALAYTLRRGKDGHPFLRFAAKGEGGLLERELLPVRVSRSMKEQDVEQLKVSLLAQCKEKGAVLIGPFISSGERRILKAAMESGVSVIFLAQFDISDESKVPLVLMPALREGRCLLLAPWPQMPVESYFIRSRCQLLNNITEILANRKNSPAFTIQ